MRFFGQRESEDTSTNEYVEDAALKAIRAHINESTEELRSGPRTTVSFWGSIASLVSLASGPLALILRERQWVSVIVLFWFLAVMAAIVVKTVQVDHRERRQLRYALVTDLSHMAEHALRNAEAEILLLDSPREQTLRSIGDALGYLAQVFTVATGTPCRACIKQLHDTTDTGDPDDIDILSAVVSDLCRDKHRPVAHPSTATGIHQVGENTDFYALFVEASRHRWWWCNDIMQLKEYRNSSVPRGGERSMLPYRSVATWPIRYVGASTSIDTIGFVCVDSPAVDAFDVDFDFGLGAAFADSAYGLLKLMELQDSGKSFSSTEQPMPGGNNDQADGEESEGDDR